MKTQNSNPFSAFFCKCAFLLFLLPFFGCNREKSCTLCDTTHLDLMGQEAAKINQPAASCYCATSLNCPSSAALQIIQTILGGSSISYNKTITWNKCVTLDPALAGTSACNSPYSNVTTQLTLCYFDCNTITAKFVGKPPCLPCMPSNFCIQLTPTKTNQGNNTYYVLSGSYNGDPLSQVQIQVVISTDPDITIMCSNSGGYNFTCSGNF
jgi:hypothetical protein